MAMRQPSYHYSIEEYLMVESALNIRHEYMDGQIYAMTGGTERHAKIMANINGELRTVFKGKSTCFSYQSELKISVRKGFYTYPDVSVICGEVILDTLEPNAVTNPSVLVEVLSPSTASYDKTTKWLEYQQIATLQDYLIVEQATAGITRYSRQPSGWLIQTYDDLNQRLMLPSVNVELLMADIYYAVTFD